MKMVAIKRQGLEKDLGSLLESAGFALTEKDRKYIPKKWDIFSDLVLLPADAFSGGIWISLEPIALWKCVAKSFHVDRVARQGRIRSDAFRSPRVEMLLGSNTWAKKKENGLIYELNITKSMFSSGNITEKTRMLNLDCEGDVIVDLFAGIGYFTIPLLKAGAAKVYACEWNPYAVEALRRNLKLNRMEDRCEVLFGDNRQVAPVGVADRVVLGLIPSSEMSWPAAIKCLKTSHGGVLHVHMNVETLKTDQQQHVFSTYHTEQSSDYFYIASSVDWKNSPLFRDFAFTIMRRLHDMCNEMFLERWLITVVHFERVKSYGPKVWHCVYDVELRPLSYRNSSSNRLIN
ncbi:hypothetical protein RvY_09398 [Ramazzottius varieornatus]|uniref:tRNA(Phe) (4-demethylwyosine(37)-C(7)) aminocarboxypropyltransferase n=1 Tax=Ramazzottius varieornatus TaxID=947166 RepID=A0A1D1VDS9_RAMVA|nr:hypothetical protein RvY_09398 [Ramazzottius varieornatus]